LRLVERMGEELVRWVPEHATELPAGAVAAHMTAHRGELVMCIDGELDLATAPLVRAVAAPVLVAGMCSVTVDLGGVRFIDMHGVRAVAAVVRGAAERGFRPRVVMPRAVPRVILEQLTEALRPAADLATPSTERMAAGRT
jgi:anti-anti-sigma factor